MLFIFLCMYVNVDMYVCVTVHATVYVWTVCRRQFSSSAMWISDELHSAGLTVALLPTEPSQQTECVFIEN